MRGRDVTSRSAKLGARPYSTRESRMECTGAARAPSVPPSARWPWSWAWRRSASSPPVAGAGRARRPGPGSRRQDVLGRAGRVRASNRAGSPVTAQPAVGQPPVDLGRGAAEPVRHVPRRPRRPPPRPSPPPSARPWRPRRAAPASGRVVDAGAPQLVAQLVLDADPAGGGGHLQPDRRQRLALQREARLQRARRAELGAQDPRANGEPANSAATSAAAARPATAPCARAPTPAGR